MPARARPVRLARRALPPSQDRAGARGRRRADRLPTRPGRVPAEHEPGPDARDVRPHRAVSRMSPAEFPALTFAARAPPRPSACSTRCGWTPTTAGSRRAASATDSTASVVAVAVSLVDFRTGYLADLEGIRQVIGDRLLIVDAMQGVRRGRRAVRGRRRRGRRRPEVGARRMGHRLPRAQRPRRSTTSPRCGRDSPPPTSRHAPRRGAAPDPRRRRVPGQQPRCGGAGALRRGPRGDRRRRGAGDQRRDRASEVSRSSTSPTSTRCR